MLTASEISWWQTTYNISYYVLLGALFVSFVATGLTFIANDRLATDLTVRLTATTKTAGEANERAGSAIERAASLEAQAADARRQEAELRLALNQEIAARQPRRLTETQSAMIVATLKDAPKCRVIVKPNFMDMEATVYANDISAAFTAAGFENVGDAPLQSVIAAHQPGIFVSLRSVEDAPVCTDAVLQAFGVAQVPVTVAINEWSPNNETLVIVVSRKP